MTHYMGIDSSTTATKALVVDQEGSIVATGRSEYGFETPHPMWAEQDPNLWWAATVDAIRSAMSSAGISGKSVKGIALTGQMHGLVTLDRSGEVLRPAILWNDQRTQAECDQIRELVGRDRLIAVTGNDALTGFTAPKIRWVMQHEPDIARRIEHILLPKDYVRYRLTGAFATDKAGGSGTILFDLAERTWSREIAARLDIPMSWLPETFEGTDITATVDRNAAAATGLAAGTPVFGGGGDQAANAVGVGAVSEGVVAMSIGTSGVVFAPTAFPTIEPDGRLHAFCHAVPGMWHLMGVMLSAAGSLQWFRDRVAPERSFEELSDAAAHAPPTSSGLTFLPYLSGERTPHPDPLARGAFVGLTVRHGLEEMARAVMEGVAYGLKDITNLIDASADISELRASGGGASSGLWIQIISDVLGLPVQVVGTQEGAAHGAALLAATGDGSFLTVTEACEAGVRVVDTIEPSADAATYAAGYEVYRDLYPALKTAFERSAHLDQGQAS